MDPFFSIMRVSGAALDAQTLRIRTISENIANVQSAANTPGGTPYMRKTVSFESVLDREAGANVLRLRSIDRDRSPFRTEYDPTHPAADDKGYVKLPNVNLFLEVADLKEANRTFQANLQTFKLSKELFAQTIELLKA